MNRTYVSDGFPQLESKSGTEILNKHLLVNISGNPRVLTVHQNINYKILFKKNLKRGKMGPNGINMF